MEFVVNALIFIWLRIRRKYWRLEYLKAYRLIKCARLRLEKDWMTRASTISRGYLLQEQQEALDILLLLEDDLSIDMAYFAKEQSNDVHAFTKNLFQIETKVM